MKLLLFIINYEGSYEAKLPFVWFRPRISFLNNLSHSGLKRPHFIIQEIISNVGAWSCNAYIVFVLPLVSVLENVLKVCTRREKPGTHTQKITSYRFYLYFYVCILFTFVVQNKFSSSMLQYISYGGNRLYVLLW